MEDSILSYLKENPNMSIRGEAGRPLKDEVTKDSILSYLKENPNVSIKGEIGNPLSLESKNKTSTILDEDFKKWQKEIQKHIGGISKSNGDVAEEMIYNSLEQDMIFADVVFYSIEKNVKRKSIELNIEGEYDILLKNEDTIAIIEVKWKVRCGHISKLVETQLKDFRKLYPEYRNHKIILGIGGMSFEKISMNEARENGIAVIKVSPDKIEYHIEDIKEY